MLNENLVKMIVAGLHYGYRWSPNEADQLYWTQFDKKNAYWSSNIALCLHELDGEPIFRDIVAFRSYHTVVGFEYNNTFYECGKYSVTTSRQVTQYCNRFNLKRVFVDCHVPTYCDNHHHETWTIARLNNIFSVREGLR